MKNETNCDHHDDFVMEAKSSIRRLLHLIIDHTCDHFENEPKASVYFDRVFKSIATGLDVAQTHHREVQKRIEKMGKKTSTQKSKKKTKKK